MPVDSDKKRRDDTAVAPAPAKPKRQPNPKPKLLPPYAVILHNDSFNGFDYVVRTLQKVFGYGSGKAFWLTLRAHCSGRSLIWAGHKEHAELKAEQVRGCGPDPRKLHVSGARPL